jgi:hypothetical protein
MTSFRQVEANRRNARRSTGPITEEGKQRSRCNAVRHGLTAETVIGGLEDAEDYQTFEATIIADYDAQSAVERELVLRLASLLWRLRRATTMETGLFEMQANHLREFKQARQAPLASREVVYAMLGGGWRHHLRSRSSIARCLERRSLAEFQSESHRIRALLFASCQSAQLCARSPEPL